MKALRVLKFGSSVLGRPEEYGRAAEEVRAEVAGGCKVVAVVSAMGRTTDQLLAASRMVAEAPADPLVAALLGTGEESSVALLAMALDARGASVRAFTRTTVPIRTRGPLQDADPVDVDAERILSILESVDVVVFPGFVGVDAAGGPSLLGRGGTDLTALFLGHALGAAEVRLVKDVDGIFPGDPGEKPDAAPFAYLSWEGARRIGGGVVQEKALAFAARHGLGFRVAAPGGRGTWVGALAEVPPGSATRAGQYLVTVDLVMAAETHLFSVRRALSYNACSPQGWPRLPALYERIDVEELRPEPEEPVAEAVWRT